jgi:hypothetical protein
MATLIVDFHCMCLFVPDAANNAMHVLMPSMQGHDPHVVRMRHRSFAGQPDGRPMEGWSLDVAGAGATDLDLNTASTSAPEIPDLTTISGKTVDQASVSSMTPAGVVSRVTFRAGRAGERDTDQFLWRLGGISNRILANTASWVIPGVPDELKWDSLGATVPKPILRLSELSPEADDLFRISIHHETPGTLPGRNGALLTASQLRHHFAVFYGLLGMTPLPSPSIAQDRPLLPIRQTGGGGGGVKCKNAMARLTL